MSPSFHGSAGFNPRAHVGRDFSSTPKNVLRKVSIHAPTWGATKGEYLLIGYIAVSIHAPTWGATRGNPRSSMTSLFQSTRPRGARPRMSPSFHGSAGFNPRAHVGRDCKRLSLMSCVLRFQSTRPRGARLANCWFHIRKVEVSIHAPTWGATSRSRGRRWGCSFQSTRPRGARRLCLARGNVEFTFQSTRPRGARLIVSPGPNRKNGFNPRAHVGRDSAQNREGETQEVSIHAPTWGATDAADHILVLADVSIHAPTWGATDNLLYHLLL